VRAGRSRNATKSREGRKVRNEMRDFKPDDARD
jgi:hypothetical protein